MKKLVKFIASVALLQMFNVHADGVIVKRVIEINDRRVELYSPYQIANKEAPVIIALHGGLTDSETFAEKIKFERTLRRVQAHGVFINGTNQRPRLDSMKTWNAGKCCGRAKELGVDDIAYMKSVILELIQSGIAKRQKVSLIGSSNGAMMSLHFACENNHLVSNVYALGGTFMSHGCSSLSGVKVHFIHGKLDETVPLTGGGKGMFLAGEPFPSMREVRSTLLEAGAEQVKITILETGEHGADTLYKAAIKEKGMDLGDIFIP